MSKGHTDECRYWVTGNFNDCNCQAKVLEPAGHWAKEPFVRLDEKGNVIK